MPKRKWNRLHHDATIDDERRHRSRSLIEQKQARVVVDEGIAEVVEERRSGPPEPAPKDEER